MKDFMLICSGGFLSVLAMFFFLPMLKIIEQTNGTVGFGLAIVFFIGTAVTACIYWIVTGKSSFGRLMGD